MSTQSATLERTRIQLKEPKLYNVIMLNDDFTTMEFVVAILIDIFHKDEITAQAIMLGVHKQGKAIVDKYPYDIAVTKVNAASARAKAEGYPFRMTLEEA